MANEGNLMALLPLLVFMGIMVGISFWVRHSSQGLGRDFVSQYLSAIAILAALCWP